MREMEEVHRQREAEKAASLQQRLSRLVASLPPPHQPMSGVPYRVYWPLLWIHNALIEMHIRPKEQEFVCSNFTFFILITEF
jgi:hypothetical protein